VHRDGVYIRMPFEEYVDDDAMGSGTKQTLWLRGAGWWWRNRAERRRAQALARMSPEAREKALRPTPEQLFGTALHAALLEGLHAYETRFFVEPAKEDHPDALFTVEDIKAALKDAGCYPHGSSTYRKEDWLDAADTYLPEARRRAEITANGARVRRLGISEEEDFAIRAMRDLAVDAAHSSAEMRETFSVGTKFPILAEISVFYTDEAGQRHRARFDKLLPVITGDLKSVGEWRGRPLAHALHDHIVTNAYDVQLADYHIARQAMIRMVCADPTCIHGGTAEERTHLQAMCEWNRTNRWEWLWIFAQKPTASGNAPVIFPLRQRWGSGYHLSGFRKRQAGLALYRDCMERFGPDRPWGRVEPIHWTSPDEAPKDEPSIAANQFGWGPDDPAEGETEHFQGEAT
jgi:hypothetical protein